MSDMRGMRGKSGEAQVSEQEPTSVVMDVKRNAFCAHKCIYAVWRGFSTRKCEIFAGGIW